MRWNSEKVLSLSALVISLATLVTLMYQSKIMREHEENSSFPKLELWNNNLDTKYQLELKNTGLGPGILEDIKIAYKDSIYDLDPRGFARLYLDTVKFPYSLGTSTLVKGRIVQPGEKIWPIQILKDSAYKHPLVEIFGSGEANVIINYSSVYRQHWQIEGIGSIPILQEEEPQVISKMLKP